MTKSEIPDPSHNSLPNAAVSTHTQNSSRDVPIPNVPLLTPTAPPNVLEATFLHAQSIGRTTERKLWEVGARDWDAYLAQPDTHWPLTRAQRALLTPTVEESKVRLEAEDFAWATRAIVSVANRHCAGKIISSLEGGYDLAGLASSALAHVRALREP